MMSWYVTTWFKTQLSYSDCGAAPCIHRKGIHAVIIMGISSNKCVALVRASRQHVKHLASLYTVVIVFLGGDQTSVTIH